MRVRTNFFWMPKTGNSQDEYEDAYFPRDKTNGEMESFRCAIADGATETSFARQWADILVQDFVEQRSLEESRRQWQEKVSVSELPWYAEQKASQGAFAAFAALVVTDDHQFEMFSAGDCCIVRSRAGQFQSCYPKEKGSDFDNRPALLCSRAGDSEVPVSTVKGSYEDGDEFWLLSDAVARWTLFTLEAGENVIQKLYALRSDEDFREWSEAQKKLSAPDGKHLLVNDDLTIYHVQIN